MKKVQKYRSAGDGTRIGVRAYPDVNERVPVIGSYSEVMIHFGLAGKPIEVSLVRNTLTRQGWFGRALTVQWHRGRTSRAAFRSLWYLEGVIRLDSLRRTPKISGPGHGPLSDNEGEGADRGRGLL
jgi:hypothetical protein